MLADNGREDMKKKRKRKKEKERREVNALSQASASTTAKDADARIASGKRTSAFEADRRAVTLRGGDLVW